MASKRDVRPAAGDFAVDHCEKLALVLLCMSSIRHVFFVGGRMAFSICLFVLHCFCYAFDSGRTVDELSRETLLSGVVARGQRAVVVCFHFP